MDMNDVLDGSSAGGSELVITGGIRAFLHETARWAKFIAIVGFVFFGIAVLLILIGGGTFLSLMTSNLGGGVGGGVGLIVVFYFIIFAIGFMVLLALYRFATNLQMALQADDQMYLTTAFENLKRYFKITGIMTAIVVGIYALFLVFGLLFGIGSAFM